MRKMFFYVIVLLLAISILTLITGDTTVLSIDNLIVNGDFSTSELVWTGDGDNVKVIDDGKLKGSKSTTTSNHYFYLDDIILEDDHVYSFSFKFLPASPTDELFYEYTDVINTSISDSITDAVWNSYAVEVTVGDDRLLMIIENTASSVTSFGWYDDFVLVDLTSSFEGEDIPTFAEFQIMIEDEDDYFESFSYEFEASAEESVNNIITMIASLFVIVIITGVFFGVLNKKN